MSKLKKSVALISIFLMFGNAVTAFLAVSRRGTFLSLRSIENSSIGQATVQGISIFKVIIYYYLFTFCIIITSCLLVRFYKKEYNDFEVKIISEISDLFNKKTVFIPKYFEEVFFALSASIPVLCFVLFRKGYAVGVLSTLFVCISALILAKYSEVGTVKSAHTVSCLYALVVLFLTCFDIFQPYKLVFLIIIESIVLIWLQKAHKFKSAFYVFEVCAIVLPWFLLGIRQLVIHNMTKGQISVLVSLFCLFFIGWALFEGNERDFGASFHALSFASLTFAGAVTGLFGAFETNLFEGANHGCAVFDWIALGRIPILENFDAHMLSNFLPGVIDSLLSGNIQYSNQCVGYELYLFLGLLIHYFFFKICFKDSSALMMLFFVPISLLNYKTNSTNFAEHLMSVGLILVVMFYWWYGSSSIFRNFILWIGLSISVLFSLDVGVSFGVATGIVSTIVCARQKDGKKLFGFFFSGIIVFLLYLISFLLLCRLRNINTIEWFYKFVNTSLSNQNWAHGVYNDNKQLLVIFSVYIVMPLLVVPYSVFKFMTNLKDLDVVDWITLILLLTFLLNLPRTLVRHTVIEGYSHFIWLLALILASSLRQLRNPELIIVPLLFVMIFASFNTSLFGETIIPTLSSTYRFSFLDTFEIVDNQEKKTALIKEQLDYLLDNHETFLDFSNNTLLYQYSEQHKPVYVNQSPGLVNGRKGQEIFLNEIENCEDDVVLVLMPTAEKGGYKLDGVLNSDRFYMISSFINQNYSPLCYIDGFAIWGKNEMYTALERKLESLKGVKRINSISYIDDELCFHDLGIVPYLWGCDSTNGYDTARVVDLTAEKPFSDAIIEESSKNTLLFCRINISSEKDGNASIVFSDSRNEKKTTYSFLLKQGIHDYVFCISSDVLWNRNLLKELHKEGTVDYTVNRISFEEEDYMRGYK